MDILTFIEDNYGLLLSYKDLDLNTSEKLNLQLSANSQDELLTRLLNELQLDVQMIDDNQWVLSTKQTSYKCGKIFDELSSQALAFANIFSADSIIGSSSDEDGFFLLPSNLDEDKSFKASYLGYDQSTFQIKDLVDCASKEDFLNNPNAVNINMEISSFNIPFLLIKEYITDGIDLNQNGFSTRVKPKNLGALPGQVDPDIMKSIQFLPGVTAPSSRASDIYIRGGTPDQNLILWEDIPIYHSAHYFGMISAVDPYVISEMNVYRGGFDASYGGRASGVIDIKSFGLDHKDSFLGIGSNLVNTYVYGHQKFGNKIKNSITFSVRRSFAEAWESPTIKNITRNNQQGLIVGNAEISNSDDNIEIEDEFNFLDTHVKLSSQLSEKTRLNISGIYATNDFMDEIFDPLSEIEQKDTMLLQNTGASFNLNHQWSEKFSSQVKGVWTNYNYTYDYKVEETDDSKNRLSGMKSNMIRDRQLQFASKYMLPKDQFLNFGYQLTNYYIRFEVNEDRRGRKDLREKGNSNGNLHASFISYNNPIQNIIGIDAGIRLNYYDLSGDLYLEPRVKLSYQLLESLSLHANYGKHHQFIGQTTNYRESENGISIPIWQLSENKSIPIVEADQVQLGLVFSKNNWVLDLQLYNKEITGLNSDAYDFEEVETDEFSVGKSRSRGFDILLKKRFNKHIRTWISYTCSNVELNFSEIDRKPFPSDFDQRHNFKWSGQYRHKDFQFAAGLFFGSGLPFTDVEDFQVVNQQNNDVFFDIDYEDINSDNLKNTVELNLSSQYSFSIPNSEWEAHLSASVTNLLNRDNVYNRSFYIDDSGMGPANKVTLDKSNLPATFNCSLRFEL